MYAEKVYCIDLENFRLRGKSLQGAEFSVKDATKMTFVDNTFDTVVLYNAFFIYRNSGMILKMNVGVF